MVVAAFVCDVLPFLDVSALVVGTAARGRSGQTPSLAPFGVLRFPVNSSNVSLLMGGLGLKSQCCGQRRFRGGGAAPSDRATVKAVCLSIVGDPMQLDLLWAQEWVETWAGWKELEEDGSDDKAVELAQRFLHIAGMNIPTQRKSNRERLRNLQDTKGLRLRAASSHGVNNCLIDAILIGLDMQGFSPQRMTLAKREELCAECREMLHDRHGVPFGVYLDGHRDAPRILAFFLGELWPANALIRVCLYDSLDHADLGLGSEELEYLDVACGSEAAARSAELHVYNHTSATGQGYHFDALVHVSLENGKGNVGEQEDDGETLMQVALNAAAAKALERPTATPTTCWAASVLAVPSPAEVQTLLQGFVQSRGVQIMISEEDARAVVALWGDREGMCSKLHTLHQAGLAYADSGWHASMRLVDQWQGYCNSCRQGPAQTLGQRTDSPNENLDMQPLILRQRKNTAPGVPIDGAKAKGLIPEKRMLSMAEQPRSCPPVKRLRKKTPAAVAMGNLADGEALRAENNGKDVDGEDMFILRCDTVNEVRDPRAVAEREIKALSRKLTEKPTLPLQYQNLCLGREAYDLPLWHCGFRDCMYATENENELAQHICSNHMGIFAEVCGKAIKEEDMRDMYRAAITLRCQSAAPVANVSIDRRALRSYQKSLEANNISCLLCFVCARKYPYVKTSRNQEIGWVQPVDARNETVFGQPVAAVEKTLGLQAFKEKYVDKEITFAQQEMNAELEDWISQVEFGTACVKLVCCPEDKVCRKKCKPKTLCSQCWVPVCRTCRIDLVSHGRQPAAALSNDMMVYYAPRQAFSLEVTVMEMLCASPCLTTMICFSLEQKLRGDRAWDQDAWMNRQRMAMRGNATTFPLAWEDLLQQMQALEATSQKEGEKVKLPHSGAKLREVVSVIVKSHKGHETLDLGRILHQARVRRAVVVRLIEDAVARGHPAFQGIHMEQMYTNAKALPEDGIPGEVIAELPYDSDLNAIMRQKAATPVRQEMAAEELAEEMKSMAKPNAVVGERTSVGMADVNAQHVSALQATAARSQGPEKLEEATGFTLRTGNRLLDQFRPQYFGVAFPYVFKFCTGMPDPPAWSSVARYRRDEAAPRVELQEWVQIMARRCEAQVCRDWVYGFAAWNLYFRSALNLSRNVTLFSAPVLDEGARVWKKLVPKDIEAGAIQLVRALQGQGMVLCPCQAEAHGMAAQGRKNRIGALHGPYGNEWLNCCHPALLAALRGVNVDVQLPYRLPFDCENCGRAVSKEQRREIVRAVQRAQDAQTGYCADYCAKNQPMAFHEIKEFQKGHQQLHSKYGQEPLEKLGKRHVTRFLSDAYCKGIVRGQVECCNLRAYNNPTAVVAAERISTVPFFSFPGRAFLQAVNAAYDEMEEWRAGKKQVWTKKGPGGQRQLRELDPAQAYGHRPQREDIWCLSPYEFSMYWDCVPVRLPHTRAEFKLRPAEEWDVTVTAKGAAKFVAAACDEASVRLIPGVDFRRREGKPPDARVFFASSAGRYLQHGWYLRPRWRALCPPPANSPVPSKWGDDPERNAKLTLAYFRAWTLNKQLANEAAPHLQSLRLRDGTWEESLRQWLRRLPCEETKRYVGNFLAVYRVRPENEGENSDDEDDTDNLVVTAGDLAQACDTHVPLVWGASPNGIHGVTELVECERTGDIWLQTLQNEVRNGALSETNHQFLHGFATRVPGSWNGQKLECSNASCQELLTQKASPEKIQRLECKMCSAERRSKARVVDKATQAKAEFAKSKAIFATNAVKYHVNKLRAKAWAAETGQVLHHAIAKDRISSMALREKPDLGKDKFTWLQRHDQDCGSLYGVLPLCLGMPVAATDHLDRNRGILRGCAGEVVGWVWGADAGNLSCDFSKMMDNKNAAVKKLTGGEVSEGLRKAHWPKLSALSAAFIAWLATGSEIIEKLPFVEVDEEQIVSSTGALALKQVPEKMVVIGGGVIGLELGSVYERLGSKVVEFLPTIGGIGIDGEVSKEMQKILTLGEKTVTGVEKTGGVVKEANVVLVCVGRREYRDGLGVEEVGVELDGRKIKAGKIRVLRMLRMLRIGKAYGKAHGV
eukprot:Skav211876  [mRNA]  locus=scaffold1431:374175:389938:+ [translate_table: standard]